MTFDIFARLPGNSEDAVERKLVQFRIDRLRCGIDIMDVREIVNPGEVTSLPNTPPYVIGAADHREAVVPVIDMRLRFGLSPSPSGRSKWIIATGIGPETALQVDSVHGVRTVSKKMERERHPLMDGTNEGWVMRVYGDEEGLIFELDAAMIAQSKPLQIPPEALAELESGDTY